MRLVLALTALLLSGCASTSPTAAHPSLDEERADRARLKQAYEIGRQWRQQYIAAKRPVFRLKFRHEYPSMSEEEIEVLVNDAVEEGLQKAVQKERERTFGGPVASPPVRPPVSCTSSQMGSYTYTDCY